MTFFFKYVFSLEKKKSAKCLINFGIENMWTEDKATGHMIFFERTRNLRSPSSLVLYQDSTLVGVQRKGPAQNKETDVRSKHTSDRTGHTDLFRGEGSSCFQQLVIYKRMYELQLILES